jgi:hypothetical protein
MKCPACKNPLREKGAGDMTLDVCYGAVAAASGLTPPNCNA